MNIPTTKYCPKCKRDLPFKRFYMNKKSGKYYYCCRQCASDMKKQLVQRKKEGLVTPIVRYTKEDIEYLKKHYEKESTEIIAQYLGRSKASVSVKAFKLGLVKKRERKNEKHE